MDQFLSLYMYRYRKGVSGPHGLLPLTEKWEEALANEGGAMPMNFSKAFEPSLIIF